MIHESINPQNHDRVLINLNQVAHITIYPNQNHINVQFGGETLRLSCASSEAANLEYLSIKRRMEANGSAREPGQQTTRKPGSAGNEPANLTRGVFAIHAVPTGTPETNVTDIVDPKRHLSPARRRTHEGYPDQEEAPLMEFSGNAALFEQYEPLPNVTRVSEERDQAENLYLMPE